jgi:cysteine desulfurase
MHCVNLDNKGNVDFGHLEQLLDHTQGSVLVCLMHANNEIGNILDIDRVGELCAEYNALFFSDTVQTIAHLPIDLQKTKVHFISGSAHKFHGPKGVGFVYIKNDYRITPLMYGGSQERNMRSGTENIYGIVGLAKAMQMAYSNLKEQHQLIEGLKTYFFENLQKRVPGITVNGNYGENSLFTILNVAFPSSEHGDFLVYNLDINEIAASAGSACTSGSEQGSHVLQQLHIPEGSSSVRFSFSKMNTHQELDYVIGKLAEQFAPKIPA